MACLLTARSERVRLAERPVLPPVTLAPTLADVPSTHWKNPQVLSLPQVQNRRPLLVDSLTTVRSAAGTPHWHWTPAELLERTDGEGWGASDACGCRPRVREAGGGGGAG